MILITKRFQILINTQETDREVRDICDELGIPDLNVNEKTANHIKTAVIDHHNRTMMEEIDTSKKMLKHKNYDFSRF